jgi:hypothetical protein
VTATLPVIALVQSKSVDADFIEASLRGAGMRNPLLRYDSADAFIATLPSGQSGDDPYIAMAIVEGCAWKRLSDWRTCLPHLLPIIVTFEHDRDLQEFSQAHIAHAAGALKPFTPRTLIHMLEPLRCRWLLMNRDDSEEDR